MKYFPLVWSALWRKPTEAVLIWLAVTASFTLFGFMVGLHAAYDRIVANARMDRLEVDSRFPSAGAVGILLPSAARDEIARVEGVAAVGSGAYVRGYYRDPHLTARVMAVDEHMQEAQPEMLPNAAQWQRLRATPMGVFISAAASARLGLKAGDPLPIITPPGARTPGITRADGTAAWHFQVLGVIPTQPHRGQFNNDRFIIGNLSYVQNAWPLQLRGYVWGFRVTVRDVEKASDVAVRIDQRLANSSTPTLTIPDKVGQEDAVNSGISVASKTWPVAGAGIFMILLLTANGIAQSVRERTAEFGVLKTFGYSDTTLMTLVFAEVAIPCLAGASLGTGLAALLAQLPTHYLPTEIRDLPQPTLTPGVMTATAGCALLLALASAAIPLRRVRRLSVTDALAGR
ncbi:MAG TPA: ABC transporter permease [Steroidobacteraceae bacterium]|nr:ABC transporter permease [Steroidobacteraceae bacterium]